MSFPQAARVPALPSPRVAARGGWGHQVVLLVAGAAALAGCNVETPPNAVAAPDPTKITVYFPLDNRVLGRGSPGAVPASTKFVFIRPLARDATFSLVRLNDDGSFDFAVSAASTEILELAVAVDQTGKVRGAPTFIEVPTRFADSQRFVCCKPPGMARGRCEPDGQAMCKTSNFMTSECGNDLECGGYNRETIGITDDAFRVARPDTKRAVVVESTAPGKLPPLTLVQLENRGIPGERTRPFIFRTAGLTDEAGNIRFEVQARGDDELVLRLYAIDALNRSREHALYVPDATVANFDVLGILPYGPLRNGEPGNVAIRFAVSGEDQNGVCLDRSLQDDGPSLCFSGGNATNQNFGGGLEPTAVSFKSGQITLGGQNVPLRLSRDPRLRFTDGDVRATARDIYVLVDHSEVARSEDERGVRLRAARVAINAARAQDRVSLQLLTGGSFQVLSPPIAATPENKRRLTELLPAPTDRPSGAADLYGALVELATPLRDQVNPREVRVMALMASSPVGCLRYDEALTQMTGDEDLARAPLPTFIINMQSPNRLDCYPSEMACPGAASCSMAGSGGGQRPASDLDSLARFSGGDYLNPSDPQEFVTQATRLASLFVGSFVLVYSLDVPKELGNKLVEARIEAQLTLGAEPPRDAVYQGWLELRDATTP